MRAFFRSFGWALASAIALASAFPVFHLYPLAWIALAPLFYRTAAQPPRAAALQFFVTGWLFHTILLQWLVANIFWAGGWAILGQQGLCLVLAAFWAVAGALWAWLNRLWPDYRTVLLIAGCWISMEWLQNRVFTGFCWGALGYSQGPDAWFAQLASLGGVILLSGVLVAVNALIAQAARGGALWWRPAVYAAAVLLFVHAAGFLLYGPDRRGESDYTVGLYQSNYPQHMKWDPDFQDEMLDLALAQSRAVAAAEAVDLFVWPEALVMDDFRAPRVLDQLRDFASETGIPLYTGAVRRDAGNGASYNSSVLVQSDGSYGTYDKVHLAPFGEYIPFEEHLSFARSLGAQGGITPGDEQVALEAGGRSFGPLICFEVLFAPQASQCRRLGADFLVVVTNLAWFGRSNILGQELEIARFRAIENRLPLVQCANTGVSAVIDPYGRTDVIDGYVGRQGYVTWREGKPSPADAMAVRRAGALPVAPAARMLLPGSVDWFGRLVPLFTLAGLIGAAVVDWRRKMGP